MLLFPVIAVIHLFLVFRLFSLSGFLSRHGCIPSEYISIFVFLSKSAYLSYIWLFSQDTCSFIELRERILACEIMVVWDYSSLWRLKSCGFSLSFLASLLVFPLFSSCSGSCVGEILWVELLSLLRVSLEQTLWSSTSYNLSVTSSIMFLEP